MKSMNNTALPAIISSTKPTHSDPKGMFLGHLGIKQVMIADMQDGAPIDASIKIKPNRNGLGLVLKCVDKGRLIAGLAQAGVDYRLVRIVRGQKHWIAFLEDQMHTSALVKA